MELEITDDEEGKKGHYDVIFSDVPTTHLKGV